MNLPLRIALLGSFALSVACTSSWQEEPETPRAAWEEETPPGTSTAAPPYPTPQAQTVTTQNPEDVEETDPAAMATFQPALQPYGTWVDDPVYGTVWVPDPNAVGSDFQPYVTNGHWTYTDEGYYWASDYEWGWATFHYGRWAWVDGNGWVWIPGARYSPAWVDWRYGNGYIGWGPMYPHYCWHGYTTVWIGVGPTPYVFAPSHSFFHPHPSTVIVGPSAGPGLVASTHPYAPAPVVGQKPFAGPDPKTAGIPTTSMPKAPTQPNKNVAWNPAPGSKIAPNPGGMAAVKPGTGSPSYPKYPSSAPGSKPMGVAPGGSKSLGSVPSYDTPAATGPKYNGPTAKPYPGGSSPSYGGPTYKPSTPSYGGSPSYKPSTPYGGSPSYKPSTPSYGGAPTYKPPTYSSPPPSYKPPSYSPPTYSAPKSYSPPSSVHPSAPTYSAPSKPSKPTYSAPAHVGKHK